MTKRILIIGAAGFIGRHLAEALARSGVQVIAATKRPVHYDSPLVENVVAAYDEADHFAPLLERCSAVVHAASSSTPASTDARPQLDGNLRPTLALIESLQGLPGRRLVYLSSGGTLYGNCDHAARESDMLRPRSYHGAGKAAAEQFIHAWASMYGGTAIVLRPSNVYGPGQAARSGFGVIPAAFDCILKGAPLPVWGDGQAVRDYLYVHDLVELCLVALEGSVTAGLHVLNASSGTGVCLNELFDLIERVTRSKLQRKYSPERRVDVRRIVLDNSASREMLGWLPMVSLEEGLRRSWQWFRTHAS